MDARFVINDWLHDDDQPGGANELIAALDAAGYTVVSKHPTSESDTEGVGPADYGFVYGHPDYEPAPQEQKQEAGELVRLLRLPLPPTACEEARHAAADAIQSLSERLAEAEREIGRWKETATETATDRNNIKRLLAEYGAEIASLEQQVAEAERERDGARGALRAFSVGNFKLRQRIASLEQQVRAVAALPPHGEGE